MIDEVFNFMCHRYAQQEISMNEISKTSGASQFNSASTKSAGFEQFIAKAKGESPLGDLSQFDDVLKHSAMDSYVNSKKSKADKATKALKHHPYWGAMVKQFEEQNKFVEAVTAYNIKDANLNIMGKVLTGMATTFKQLLSLQ